MTDPIHHASDVGVWTWAESATSQWREYELSAWHLGRVALWQGIAVANKIIAYSILAKPNQGDMNAAWKQGHCALFS